MFDEVLRMSEEPRMRRNRRWLKWLGISVLTSLLAVGVIWLTFQHRPGWYRPAAADEPTIERAQTESAALADETSRQIVERNGFEIRLTDRMINEWLAAMPVLWPEAREWMPPGVRDPAVGFDNGEMRVGVFVEREGWRVIANASVAANVAPDLSTINLTLRGVRGGSLPLPQGVVESVWQRMVASVRDGRIEGLDSALTPESGETTAHELAIRNRFVWPNGERPFRITHFAAEDGVLTIGVEPL